MLKNTEVRIGNFVYDIDKDIHREILEINRSYVFFKGGGCGLFETMTPIQLTEEWLIKFGFSSFEYKTGFIGKDFKSGGMILDFVLTKPKMKGEWQDTFVYDLNDHRFSKVTYLHELQNLFFILTGVELELSSNVA